MRAAILLCLLLAAPASAEVVSADAHGFDTRQTLQLVIPPAEAMAAFNRVGSWWNKDHTYSGNAANLSLEPRAGGCFCERIPASGGSIEHLRVTYAEPGKELVLSGALGPLLYEAVAGVMHVKAEPIAGGSRLIISYRAAGFAKGGAEKLAPLVDKVLTEQVDRLRTFATSGGGRR